MRNSTKIILCAVAGAVIFREIYVSGYNKGQDVVCDKLKLMLEAYEAGKKQIGEES